MKKLFAAFAAFLLCYSAFCQDNSIVLPEYVTTVSSETTEVKPDAIPDFSLVIDFNSYQLPVIRDINVEPSEFESVRSEHAGYSDNSQGRITLEGTISTGYPAFFGGKFKVFRSSDNENDEVPLPFSLYFNHDSINGYGTHHMSQGFFSTDTQISGDITFNPVADLKITADAEYHNFSNGLQGKSPWYYNLTTQESRGGTEVEWKAGDKLTLDFSAAVLYNSQFAGSSGNLSGISDSDKITMVKGLWFSPELKGIYSFGKGWSAEGQMSYSVGTDKNRFGAGISVAKNWTAGESKKIIDTAVSLGGLWLPGKDKAFVLPFAVEVSSGADLPVKFSLRSGLASDSADLIALQQSSAYAVTGTKSAEDTRWFASFDLGHEFNVQLAGAEKGPSAEAGILFEKSAFGGKKIRADFGTMPANGIYRMEEVQVTALASQVSVSIPVSLVTFGLDWNADWLDASSEKPKQTITFAAKAEDPAGNWDAELAVSEYLAGAAEDFVPKVDLSGFYRINRNVTLQTKIEDAVKLFMAQDRIFAGQYILRGGYASVSAKLNF
ncbi:MAG: hypothetical protein MJ183_04130 [Treponemataceae bacterium]|nr:hypothetical protein [Treponemataceae bacterium]